MIRLCQRLLVIYPIKKVDEIFLEAWEWLAKNREYFANERTFIRDFGAPNVPLLDHFRYQYAQGGGGKGATPYNGLYGEAPPERGAFFRLQLYKRVGKSVI